VTDPPLPFRVWTHCLCPRIPVGGDDKWPCHQFLQTNMTASARQYGQEMEATSRCASRILHAVGGRAKRTWYYTIVCPYHQNKPLSDVDSMEGVSSICGRPMTPGWKTGSQIHFLQIMARPRGGSAPGKRAFVCQLPRAKHPAQRGEQPRSQHRTTRALVHLRCRSG